MGAQANPIGWTTGGSSWVQACLLCSEGETDHKATFVVGGAFPDYGKIPYVEEDGKVQLTKDQLAQVHVSTVLKPIDRKGGTFQIAQVPRLRVATASSELRDMDSLLFACAQANGDVPPVALAFDCHLSFSKLDKWLLGMLHPSEYSELRFMSECKPAQLSFQPLCFHATHMVYKGKFPLFGCCDPKHILKAVSRALRSPARVMILFPGHC